MPDLVAELLPRLRENHLDGLLLASESETRHDIIYPDYTGQSILNIPTSICHLLGVPGLGAGPLNREILNPLGEGINRIVFILMDALALHRLQGWMEAGITPIWKELSKDGLLAPLTSISPSTTSAALTSLWTGSCAAEHGILGYEMWLKEYGIVANTILHAPISFENDSGSLAKAGFKPENFMPLPTLGPHLAKHGVKSYALQHKSIARSCLSQMFFDDVEVRAFNTAADLWVNLRHLLDQHPAERMYTWVYWGGVDHFGHFYGPDDERTAGEFAMFSVAFEQFFLNSYKAINLKDTLLILCADHGQIATSKNPQFELRNHPDLVRRFHILPSGENRLAYLFVRPGQAEAVHQYVEDTWPNQFSLLDTTHAVEAGFFGPGELHPRLYDRLGEYIVVAHGNAYLWWADKNNFLIGRHGGLHPEEMLVPFLAVRL
jgi:hypothetical protein